MLVFVLSFVVVDCIKFVVEFVVDSIEFIV